MPERMSDGEIGHGVRHFAGWLDSAAQAGLWQAIEAVLRAAPLYTPTLPRSGRPMSVQMSNCGELGWVTDKTGGYRYQRLHPVTGQPWPAMPEALLAVWRAVADYPQPPEACLINWYGPDAKLGLHRDTDEEDLSAPVVSISLGCAAWFRVGGLDRRDPTRRVLLRSGDVVVLGGPARLAYHGIDRIVAEPAEQPRALPLLQPNTRINLTLRRVTLAA